MQDRSPLLSALCECKLKCCVGPNDTVYRCFTGQSLGKILRLSEKGVSLTSKGVCQLIIWQQSYQKLHDMTGFESSGSQSQAPLWICQWVWPCNFFAFWWPSKSRPFVCSPKARLKFPPIGRNFNSKLFSDQTKSFSLLVCENDGFSWVSAMKKRSNKFIAVWNFVVIPEMSRY